MQAAELRQQAWWRESHTRDATQVDVDQKPTFAALCGRLSEFSARGALGVGSLAAHYVWEAQMAKKWPVWISCAGLPYAEDLQANGIDLQALVVVRTTTLGECLYAAEQVIRTAVCGTVVVDVGNAIEAPTPMMARLLQHARRTDTACIFLTGESVRLSSLSALISYRLNVQQWHDEQHDEHTQMVIEASVVRDKKTGRQYSFVEHYQTVPGCGA